MKYAMCPQCGRKLCRGGMGSEIEIECPKCHKVFYVHIEENDIHIRINH